jgi:hypothetical protein
MPHFRFSLLGLVLFMLVGYGCSIGPYQYEDEYFRVREVAQMPKVVDEGSGLAFVGDTSSCWTLNDGGDGTHLYQVNRQGKLLNKIELKGIRNVDWEELAADTLGNLFVGDIGNNWNVRRDLKIYRVNPAQPQTIRTISFRYPDQTKFPPDRLHKGFDCEAFFWHQDSLYLFSKNRGDKEVKIYGLPAAPGRYEAKILDRAYLEPGEPFDQEIQVTAADISPDRKTFALLTYGTIYLFEVRNRRINFRHPWHKIKMNWKVVEQVEALAFINNTDLLFTNEGGNIYEARRKK